MKLNSVYPIFGIPNTGIYKGQKLEFVGFSFYFKGRTYPTIKEYNEHYLSSPTFVHLRNPSGNTNYTICYKIENVCLIEKEDKPDNVLASIYVYLKSEEMPKVFKSTKERPLHIMIQVQTGIYNVMLKNEDTLIFSVPKENVYYIDIINHGIQK